MRRLLLAANRALVGKPVSLLSRPLLKFSAGHTWTVGHSHLGTLALGSPGRGKTTMSKTLMQAFLKRGFGGLVCVVKASAAADFLAAADLAGRRNDVVQLGRQSPHRFNPFQEIQNPVDVATMLGEVCDMIQSSQGQVPGATTDGYWTTHRDMLLYHLCIVGTATGGPMDAERLKALLSGMPQSRAEVQDPGWRERSLLWRVLQTPDTNRNTKEHAAARAFLTEEFVSFPDKTQGSIRSMVSGALHYLTMNPIAGIFGGDSTIAMSEVLNHRKLLVVDLPAMESLEGKIANLLVLFCFCRAAKRIERLTDAFLLVDECQELPCRELMKSLAVFRDRRVSTVLLTQNLGTLNAGLGKQNGENLCELMETIIALGQSHADTREWLTKHIGKEWKSRYADTTSDGKRSSTRTREEVDKVSPTAFAELDIGQSIVCFGKHHWRARWPEKAKCASLPIHIGE